MRLAFARSTTMTFLKIVERCCSLLCGFSVFCRSMAHCRNHVQVWGQADFTDSCLTRSTLNAVYQPSSFRKHAIWQGLSFQSPHEATSLYQYALYVCLSIQGVNGLVEIQMVDLLAPAYCNQTLFLFCFLHRIAPKGHDNETVGHTHIDFCYNFWRMLDDQERTGFWSAWFTRKLKPPLWQHLSWLGIRTRVKTKILKFKRNEIAQREFCWLQVFCIWQ